MTYTWELLENARTTRTTRTTRTSRTKGLPGNEDAEQHECQWLLRPSEGEWLARGLRQWANPLTDKDNKLAKTVKDQG